jgi:hypothetical protein
MEFDSHIANLEGSVSGIPCRIMVIDADLDLVNGHETLRNQLHQMHQWCTKCTPVTISAGHA